MRQHVHGVVAQLVDPLRQLPGQLFVGGIQGEVSAGVDQVCDRLGLREVNPPVEECALGEFPRQGQPGSGIEHRIEHGPRGLHAAVAVDLNDVLTGKRRRGAHDGYHHLVDPLRAVHDVAVVDRVRIRLGQVIVCSVRRPEHGVPNRHGVFAGDANNRESSLTEWSGDGGDGVVEHYNPLPETAALLNLSVASLEKQPGFLVAFLVEIMKQLAVGVARQLGGQLVEPVEVRHQVRLRLLVDCSHRGFEFPKCL